VAQLYALKSENRGKINKDKPRSQSDTGCASYENYSLRHKQADDAEKTLISISLQSQSKTNEGTANISTNYGPRLETLEVSTVSMVSKHPSLSEKLNSALSNIRKIKDRNTCEIVEHQQQAVKRKVDVKNKRKKRKARITSSSNEAMEVEGGIGADDFKKKRMKEIMKKKIQYMKICNNKHTPISMKASDGVQFYEEQKQLQELHSLEQRFSFTKEPPQNIADIADDMQANTTAKYAMDDTLHNKQPLSSSSVKLLSSTFQKLQQFKRTSSNTNVVSQNRPEDKQSVIPMDEVLNSKTGTNINTVNKQFESFHDIVNYGEKMTSSQQPSSTGININDSLVSLDRNASELPMNNSKVFGTGGDDLEELDFEI